MSETNVTYIQGYDPEPFARDMLRQNDLGREYYCHGHLEGHRLKVEIKGNKVILGIGSQEAMFDRNSLVPVFNSMLGKIT